MKTWYTDIPLLLPNIEFNLVVIYKYIVFTSYGFYYNFSKTKQIVYPEYLL